MKYYIKPGGISGEIDVPPSKSHTLRALVFALMAEGTSCIENYLPSPDTLAMIDAIKQFGAEVKMEGESLVVTGVAGAPKGPTDIINAGNSGIVLRFITAISALVDNYVIITGDESIRSRRIIQPLIETLAANGAFAVSSKLDGFAPVIVKGPISPGDFCVEGQDSQIVSALLIATTFLKGPSNLYVTKAGEKPWVDVTLGWLNFLGIKVRRDDYRHYQILGDAHYKGFSVTIPGDFSSALFPLCAALITKQTVKIHGLDTRDNQADKNFIQVLGQMGAKLMLDPSEQSITLASGSEIVGIEVDINHCIDSLPILAVVACFAGSETIIRGAKIARFKESDRIAAITKELRKMGAKIEELPDGMKIYPSKLKGASMDSHQDHRIALALMVAAFGADGESEIDGVECIVKTYPTFIHDMETLGGVFSSCSEKEFAYT